MRAELIDKIFEDLLPEDFDFHHAMNKVWRKLYHSDIESIEEFCRMSAGQLYAMGGGPQCLWALGEIQQALQPLYSPISGGPRIAQKLKQIVGSLEEVIHALEKHDHHETAPIDLPALPEWDAGPPLEL